MKKALIIFLIAVIISLILAFIRTAIYYYQGQTQASFQSKIGRVV